MSALRIWLLIAGPGWGKTTAARRLAAEAGGEVVWLTPADRAVGTVPSSGAAAVVLEDLAGEADRAYVLRLLATVEHARLVLTARQPLDLPLARRITFGEACVLGPRDLAIGPSAAGSASSVRRSDPAAGWPLGVAALVGGAPPALLDALVDEEWLAPLAPAARTAAALLAAVDTVGEAAAAAAGWDRAAAIAWGLLDPAGAWHPLARARLAMSPPPPGARARLAGALRDADPEAALALYRADSRVEEAAALLRQVGKRWLLAGETERLATALAGFPPGSEQVAPVLDLLTGAVQQARGAYPEAEAYYRRALAAFDASGARALAFEAAGDLVHLFWTTEDLARLEAAARDARAREADATPAERTELENNLACHHFARGDESAAARGWRKALDLPHLDDPQTASVQQFAALNLGILAKERGEFAEAMRLFAVVIERAERFPLHPGVPRGARLYMAAVALRQGDRRNAEACFAALGDALPEDRYRRAEFRQVEGEYHLFTGAFEPAEVCLGEALTLFAALPMDTNADAGLARNQLGVLHRHRGELAAARRMHEAALALVAPWPRYHAQVLLDAAVTALAAGEPGAAEPALAAAADLLRAAPAAHLAAAIALARGVTHARRGDAAATAAHLAEGLALVREGPLYYVPIAQRAIAPELWSLMAAHGHADLLAAIEARFPEAARAIRAGLAARATPAASPPVTLPPVAPSRVAIRCFGELLVEVAGEGPAQWPRKKAKALLAMLVLRPTGVAREEAADQLFPELGAEEGQHQLDNLLSSLRKILDPALPPRVKSARLEVRDRRIRLVRAGMAIDWDDFQAAHDAGPARWKEATALYGGDLFAEPVLQDHFEAERHQARSRAVVMLAQVAEAAWQAERWEAARAGFERLLAIEPAHEEAHCGLMRLYACLGEAALVRRQYEALAAALRREMDEAPSASARRLLAELLP